MVERRANTRNKYRKARTAWKLFARKVPSDDAASDRIYEALQHVGRTICACGSTNVKRSEGSRFFICRDCKFKTYFTVGTAFEDAARLQAWLGAIYFAEHNIAISALGYSKIAKVAYATARNCLLKAAMIVASTISESATVIIGNELLPIIFRRSRETPKRSHPQAEQTAREKELSENYKQESEDGEGIDQPAYSLSSLNPLQQQILDLISDKPTSVDDLCVLTSLPAGLIGSAIVILSLEGLIQDMPGGRYVKTMPKSPAVNANVGWITTPPPELIKAAIEFIRQHFQGVSRKCLQLYLATFWCCIDKVSWKEGALISLFLEQPPFGRNALANYVSPLLLRLPPS